MARPAAGVVTARLYDDLPELYRDLDPAQPIPAGGYPLLRWLDLLLAQLDPVDQLRERFTYVPMDERALVAGPDGLPNRTSWRRYGTGTYGSSTYGELGTADLVDATKADAGWLPWLGQLLGVSLAGMTIAEQRAALRNPSQYWARGTSDTLAAELRRTAPLSGGGYVDTRPNYGGAPFKIAVVTKRAESPANIADVVAGLTERPAGFILEHHYFEDLP